MQTKAQEMEIRDFGRWIQHLIDKKDLSRSETYALFRQVLLNQQPDLQQGAFLAALVAKGETVDEIAGAWQAIDELDTVHVSAPISGPLFENSGTGMDDLKTFNVSSAAAIVAAACGITMARHGARALTSSCGTVDILEAVGIDVECDVAVVEASLRTTGIGLFNGMSAKVHPGALGRILSQIRFGSTLNIAASLANPARPTIGLRGVYHERLLRPACEIMRQIGYTRGIVVHGKDSASGLGMDELSVCGETLIHEFTPEGTRSYTLAPEDVGIARVPFARIAFQGPLPAEAGRFLQVLSGTGDSACIDFVALNAGAILYTAGPCASIKDGVGCARETMGSGRAIAKLREWVSVQASSDGSGRRTLDARLKAMP